MARILVFAYGVACYAIFFAVFLYAIAFLGNYDVVPRTIDSGVAPGLGTALAVDLALLALFALQHSVMARPGWKRAWTRVVPEPVERPTYVLATSLCLALLFWLWQPIEGHVWDLRGTAAGTALAALYLLGWALLLYATFLIDHFDLFGLRQVWLHLRGQPYAHHPFDTPGLYRHIRHPIYLGWFVIFWATPAMSLGHLLFAIGATGYILVAVRIEERDLLDHFGDDYRRYAERTPRYFPKLRGARAEPARTSSAP